MPTGEADSDENQKRTIDIGEWDRNFITVDQEVLFEIILAANYLDIKPLLFVASCAIRGVLSSLTPLGSDISCKVVADMIKGKSADEIKQLFNFVGDFNPEEEVRVWLSTRCPEYLSDVPFSGSQPQIKENVSYPRCFIWLRN